MTANEVTYAKAWEMLDTGVRLGTLPSFAYVLGCHVLHHMHRHSGRLSWIALPEMYGKTLHFPGNDRYLAGQIELLVHEGIGTPIGPAKYKVSAHYIDALQKLHWSGILRSVLWETDMSTPTWTETHFTMDPSLREGSGWNEDTPVLYMLPSCSLQEAVETFASFMDPTLTPDHEKVGFL